LLLSILAVLPACSESFEDRACMLVPAEQMTCPPADSVRPEQLFFPDRCGDDLEITEVTGGGTRETLTTDGLTESPACCYTVEGVDHDANAECVIGRPYYEGGQALSAPLVLEGEPSSASSRAAAWAKAGAAEHASVAAFARLALQLLGHAAPSALLTGVHQAALDEIRHAELCFSLAEQFGGMRVKAGRFPFGGEVATDLSLSALAAAAVREGCLAETLGAHVAEEAAQLATEPAVRDALTRIAAEEASHAVLSFRIVAWALGSGGAEVRAAVRAALAEPWPELDVEELALRSNVEAKLLAAAAKRGVREVLEPAVARLLAA
jgi:hypothetical protein